MRDTHVQAYKGAACGVQREAGNSAGAARGCSQWLGLYHHHCCTASLRRHQPGGWEGCLGVACGRADCQDARRQGEHRITLLQVSSQSDTMQSPFFGGESQPWALLVWVHLFTATGDAVMCEG